LIRYKNEHQKNVDTVFRYDDVFYAALFDHWDELERILSPKPELVNAKDSSG